MSAEVEVDEEGLVQFASRVADRQGFRMSPGCAEALRGRIQLGVARMRLEAELHTRAGSETWPVEETKSPETISRSYLRLSESFARLFAIPGSDVPTEDNLELLIVAMGQEARRHGAEELTAASLHRALIRLCPGLWPFC